MPVYISLLRGINVGGHKRIKMAELRALYESLGLAGAQTLLQTGNVVFKSDIDDPAQVCKLIEDGIEQQFGFHSQIILRTPDELRGVIERNPLFARSAFDPKKLLVMFLADIPALNAIDDLIEAHTGPESIDIDGREAYLYYPDGMGRSKLSNVLVEKKLGVAGTGRNWNTVTRLNELAEDFEVG